MARYNSGKQYEETRYIHGVVQHVCSGPRYVVVIIEDDDGELWPCSVRSVKLEKQRTN